MRYNYITIALPANTDPDHELNVWGDKGYRMYCHMVVGNDLIFIMEKKIPHLESKADRSFTDSEYWRSEEDERIHQTLLNDIKDSRRIDDQNKRISDELERRKSADYSPDDTDHPAMLRPLSSELP